jgi:hypothetical protein
MAPELDGRRLPRSEPLHAGGESRCRFATCNGSIESIIDFWLAEIVSAPHTMLICRLAAGAERRRQRVLFDLFGPGGLTRR